MFTGWIIVVAVGVASQEWIRRGVPGAFSWVPTVAIVGAVVYMIWLTCLGSSFWRSLRRLGVFGAAWWLAALALGRALSWLWPYQPR
jgi:hypothetical protein